MYDTLLSSKEARKGILPTKYAASSSSLGIMADVNRCCAAIARTVAARTLSSADLFDFEDGVFSRLTSIGIS